MRTMQIGDRTVGDGHPCYVIAEIGINHDGSVDTAMRLMTLAAGAGADAVKFQVRRDMEAAVPSDLWDQPKLTPWGETMPYQDYRKAMEFSKQEWSTIFGHARTLNVDCFASVWDVPALSWMWRYFKNDFPAIKIPSAHLTNEKLVRKAASYEGMAVILSTGMSDLEDVKQATGWMEDEEHSNWALLHCHSSYPAPIEELNLRVIDKWRYFGALSTIPIGYSGHEVGLSTTVAAVALGANIVERHITYDRAAIGSDHAASVEPIGFERMVRDIRNVEAALGTGEKVVWDSE